MPIDEQDKKDLLRILSHVFDEQNLDGLVFLDIQKIFYYLHERLDTKNHIAQLLPYYWYVDGGMSDTVTETVDWGVENNLLQSRETQRTQNGIWYNLNPDTELDMKTGSDDLEAAIEAVDSVLSEDYDVYDDYEPKIKRHYKDAPLPFQSYFKTEVLWEVEAIDESNLRARDTETILTRLSMGESYLPLNPEFESFNTVYGRYLNTSQKYLDKSDGDHEGLYIVFESLTDDIWNLFCKQLRLSEHDDYYDGVEEEWKSAYNQKESEVIELLESFDRMINVDFPPNGENSNRVPESSGWGTVANAYLSDTEAELD